MLLPGSCSQSPLFLLLLLFHRLLHLYLSARHGNAITCCCCCCKLSSSGASSRSQRKVVATGRLYGSRLIAPVQCRAVHNNDDDDDDDDHTIRHNSIEATSKKKEKQTTFSLSSESEDISIVCVNLSYSQLQSRSAPLSARREIDNSSSNSKVNNTRLLDCFAFLNCNL